MLKDTFGRTHDYLRISLTEKCSMRCFYCMPAEGIPLGDASKIMKKDEVIDIAQTFVDLGVKKIRLTGGEPLVCKHAAEIIEALGKMPVELAITTNAAHIDKFMDSFKKASLRNINISMDSLSEEKFNQITRRKLYKDVRNNIELLKSEGYTIKINVVVMRGVNDDEIIDFVEWTRDEPIHIRFIEFMPFDGNNWNWEKVFGYKEITDKVSNVYSIKKLVDNEHSTSKAYRVDGFKGTFSIISSVTNPFCGSCNRLRLTADGKIKNCLFGVEELDLLTAHRNGESIESIIMQSVANKEKQCGGLPEFQNEEEIVKNLSKRSMIRIGG
ncbi:MAG: GTP 3',8-cyclase MoaA [Flavobacteriales bacterium]|nr:GTP 3',8-cyclase MoaA [Flavobacteriales bacterium]